MANTEPSPDSGTTRTVLVHVALPAGVLLALVGMYFSGSHVLQEAVAPAVNREFGILETLQHLLLVAFGILVARLAWRAPRGIERVLFSVATAGAIFMFLEEIDYGLHYYEALAGVDPADRATVRNLHNIRRGSGDELADIIKKAGDLLVLVWFVVLPLIAPRLKSPLLRRLAPSRWLIATVAVAFLASRLAHAIGDTGAPTNGALDKALGEFRELGTYYAWTLYAFALHKKAPPPA
ncbi:MAG: hypothetical protein QNJ98_18750 [Planctomycetota bacterium]|nr:hypothetical protein [Planctomycetota bacterium]